MSSGIVVELVKAKPDIVIGLYQPAEVAVEGLGRTYTSHNSKASSDPNNRTRLGSDGGIFTPESATPTALNWAAQKLATITYSDGSNKILTYVGIQLVQVDHVRSGKPTTRRSFSYNPDGSLAAITTTIL